MSVSTPLFRCPGTLPRRTLLKAGCAAIGGLALPDLLRLQAAGDTSARAGGGTDRSLIVLWLWGGPSHMETFDLKPEAPAEYRGAFSPIETNVPGLLISEHLPQLARHADKFAILRSVTHDSPGHVNSTHTMLTGYPGEMVETSPYAPKHPDFWSVAARFAAERREGAPIHVALPRIRYNGAAYLGGGLAPLVVASDPNEAGFEPPQLGLPEGIATTRFRERMSLLEQIDGFRRELDSAGVMPAMDRYQEKAVAMLTSGAAQRAFDLTQERPDVRERYGRHAVGQQCLLARRLVEAGVRLVSIDFPCVPGQKAFSWDDHASVWNIFDEMKIRLPVLDQVVSALLEDLATRGLLESTLVLVMGEMSHTPRLSNFNGQPGREHWGKTMSVLAAGGGLRMGQAIGATSSRGDEPAVRPLLPNDLLATWYKYLGVPLDVQLRDFAGRPVPLLPNGRPIAELGV